MQNIEAYGEFSNLAIEDYHQKLPFPAQIAEQWLSASSLKNYDPDHHCPQDFANYMLQKSSPISHSALFGTIVHMILGEPHRYKEEVIYIAAKSKAAKAYKEAVKNYPHCFVLLEAQKSSIEEAANAILKHPRAAKYFAKPCQFEVSFRFAYQGLNLQARPDMVSDDSFFVADFKTARDVTQKGFALAAEKLAYCLSPALTFLAIKTIRKRLPMTYTFLTVENTPKPRPNVNLFEVELNDDFFCAGDHLLHHCLSTHQECLKNMSWPTYHTSPLELVGERRKKFLQLKKQGRLQSVIF